MNKTFGIPYLLVLVTCSILIHCENSTEPSQTMGQVAGTISGKSTNLPPIVLPAYIFLGDSLLATSDEQGSYQINELKQGKYPLTCSALNGRDTTLQVNIISGQTTQADIELIPDTTHGRVYAEFHDLVLFRQSVQKDSSLNTWTPQEMFDGVTGATLQSKTLRYEVPDRTIHLSDSLLAISDGFGQCWFELQSGTYPIRGECEGYQDTTLIVHIPSDERVYVNFILDRSTVSK